MTQHVLLLTSLLLKLTPIMNPNLAKIFCSKTYFDGFFGDSLWCSGGPRHKMRVAVILKRCLETTGAHSDLPRVDEVKHVYYLLAPELDVWGSIQIRSLDWVLGPWSTDVGS